jgi:hypothetical protein
MKLIKNKLVIFALFAAVFAIGCFLGMEATSHLYDKYCFSQLLDCNALDLASQINIVCQLHLGQIASTIDHLEKGIDWNIVALARNTNIQKDDYRYRILRAAKTYRGIYHSRSQIADMVDCILNDIEKIYVFEYDSPLCRVVENAKYQKKL